MASEVDKLKQKLEKSKSTPKPSADSGSMSGSADDPRGRGTKAKDDSSGAASMPQKQAAAEVRNAEAKVMHTENIREQTTGDERFDQAVAGVPNIPPTIVAERLKMQQNPVTGEPWTKSEHDRYLKEQEHAREVHAKAVKESDERRAKEVATPAPQPIPHVPVSTLTEGQKKAMQDSQDRGDGPVAQAKARDANSPEEIGRRKAEANQMTDKDKQRENAGVDKDLERKELGERTSDEETTGEEEQDADDVQRDLDENKSDFDRSGR